VIFDIVEYIRIEWTMPNESRICRRGAYPKKKKKNVVGQFAVKQKLNKEDYGVRLAIVKEETRLKNNKPCCVHLTYIAIF